MVHLLWSTESISGWGKRSRPWSGDWRQQTGFVRQSRLELPPGRYQLRVAANELSSKAVGTVLYDLEVPDFSKGPLQISGVALTSPAAAQLPTVKPDTELRQVMPASPAAARAFHSTDELALFAEVYDNTASSPHKVEISTTVTADEGKVMFKTDETRDSSEIREERRLRPGRVPPGRTAARFVRVEGRCAVAPSARSRRRSARCSSDSRAGGGPGSDRQK